MQSGGGDGGPLGPFAGGCPEREGNKKLLILPLLAGLGARSGVVGNVGVRGERPLEEEGRRRRSSESWDRSLFSAREGKRK
jgi:hypothetical protein